MTQWDIEASATLSVVAPRVTDALNVVGGGVEDSTLNSVASSSTDGMLEEAPMIRALISFFFLFLFSIHFF